MKIMKTHPLLKIMNNSLIDLPTPSNISSWWNFGSLLGMCLIIQIITGIFLAMHFCADTNLAFKSIIHICRDVNYGWLIRTLHANGASIFFICLYLHVGRGLYYSSFYFICSIVTLNIFPAKQKTNFNSNKSYSYTDLFTEAEAPRSKVKALG